MTGERMETVREALEDAPCECYEVPTLVAADPGMAREVVCARCRALAEVERWERDRARLERQLAEAIAQDYCTICGAALGEGQDSDLAEPPVARWIFRLRPDSRRDDLLRVKDASLLGADGAPLALVPTKDGPPDNTSALHATPGEPVRKTHSPESTQANKETESSDASERP